VGCGSGVVAEFLAGRAQSVDAVDGNPSAIEFARAATAHTNVRYHLGLVDQMAFSPGTFDQAVCLEVIEHLFEEQILDLFRQFRVLLRPGGELLVTTPNYRSLWPAIERTMDVLRLAPRLQDDQHVTHFTLRRLRHVGLEAGLAEIRVGRFCGMAPFVSVISWKLAGLVDRLETRVASPLGNVLFALWRNP
jgi:2-polyprenyl-3-methyl-5-hydroxy-6-metoxy-1,4-benzoquinol methylase